LYVPNDLYSKKLLKSVASSHLVALPKSINSLSSYCFPVLAIYQYNAINVDKDQYSWSKAIARFIRYRLKLHFQKGPGKFFLPWQRKFPQSVNGSK
jgi:hypothetical protein